MIQLSETAAARPKDEIRQSLQSTLKMVNQHLESHEVVGGALVVNEPWTVENDVLTPTLKIKRHVLHKRFADSAESIRNNDVVWEEEMTV